MHDADLLEESLELFEVEGGWDALQAIWKDWRLRRLEAALGDSILLADTELLTEALDERRNASLAWIGESCLRQVVSEEVYALYQEGVTSRLYGEYFRLLTHEISMMRDLDN